MESPFVGSKDVSLLCFSRRSQYATVQDQEILSERFRRDLQVSQRLFCSFGREVEKEKIDFIFSGDSSLERLLTLSLK